MGKKLKEQNGREASSALLVVCFLCQIISITSEDVPSKPRNIVAKTLSPTSIEITWESPEQTKGPLTEYDLFYYVNGAVEEDEVQIDKSRTSYTLTGLEEYQEYSFRIVANNANGAGVSTEEIVARTFSDAPSDVPQNFTLETASSTSIVVRWQPPKTEHQNGIITGYKIRYKKKGAKKGLTETTAGDRDIYALIDLKKDTMYQVRISAQTVNGSGPSTDWLFGKTYSDDNLDESHFPDMPDSLVVRPMTNSLIVQWVPKRQSKYLVRGYYLGYGKGIPDVYRQHFNANTFFYTIDNLQPASEYVVSIRAFNKLGEGQPRFDTVFTLEETEAENVTPMLPPIGLKALVVSPHTIVLTWTDNSLGKIQRITDNRYYTIRSTSIPKRETYKYVNSTELVQHIDDLKPDTLYEFNVRVFKGRRNSTWSTTVSNKTQKAAPGSPPRDLTLKPVENDPFSVTLTWQHPQEPNVQITGYLVLYTTDHALDDYHWAVEGVLGEKLSMTVTDLTADTTYFFKVQARNSKGYGPMSHMTIYKTPKTPSTPRDLTPTPIENDSFSVTLTVQPPQKPIGQIEDEISSSVQTVLSINKSDITPSTTGINISSIFKVTDKTTDSTKGILNAWQIALIVIGCLLFVILVVFLVVFLSVRQRRKDSRTVKYSPAVEEK